MVEKEQYDDSQFIDEIIKLFEIEIEPDNQEQSTANVLNFDFKVTDGSSFYYGMNSVIGHNIRKSIYLGAPVVGALSIGEVFDCQPAALVGGLFISIVIGFNSIILPYIKKRSKNQEM